MPDGRTARPSGSRGGNAWRECESPACGRKAGFTGKMGLPVAGWPDRPGAGAPAGPVDQAPLAQGLGVALVLQAVGAVLGQGAPRSGEQFIPQAPGLGELALVLPQD